MAESENVVELVANHVAPSPKLKPNKKTHRRRWLQFGLRSLLLAVALLSVWLAMKVRQARQYESDMAIIRELNAQPFFDYQHTAEGNFDSRIPPSEPEWLRKLVGEKYFDRVVGVGLYRDPMPADEALRPLSELKNLRSFHMRGGTLGPVGLKSLSQLPELADVHFEYVQATHISPSALALLKSARKLEKLVLFACPLADADLAHLSQLSQVRILVLSHSNLTDAGLVHLDGLTGLEQLHFGISGMTRAGVEVLHKKIPGCEIHYYDNQKKDFSVVKK